VKVLSEEVNSLPVNLKLLGVPSQELANLVDQTKLVPGREETLYLLLLPVQNVEVSVSVLRGKTVSFRFVSHFISFFVRRILKFGFAR
jgi:hypothetical protein